MSGSLEHGIKCTKSSQVHALPKGASRAANQDLEFCASWTENLALGVREDGQPYRVQTSPSRNLARLHACRGSRVEYLKSGISLVLIFNLAQLPSKPLERSPTIYFDPGQASFYLPGVRGAWPEILLSQLTRPFIPGGLDSTARAPITRLAFSHKVIFNFISRFKLYLLFYFSNLETSTFVMGPQSLPR